MLIKLCLEANNYVGALSPDMVRARILRGHEAPTKGKRKKVFCFGEVDSSAIFGVVGWLNDA